MTESAAHLALAGDGYVGAIDLGGTKILAAIVSPDGRIVARSKKATGKKGKRDDVASVIDRMAEAVREAAAAAGIGAPLLRAVGVGAPGPVSPDTGIVAVAVNIPGWKDVPLKSELEARLGVPVTIDNDVRVAVMAEHAAGAGQGTRNMVGIWPGTGVGGGVIVDGQVVRGEWSSAGEIGHITIKHGGAKCACGGRGHLEALASRSAIARWAAKRVKKGEKSLLSKMARDGDVSRITSGDLADALHKGDKLAVAAVDRAADYLAVGIVSIANVLNPQRVVLGGGLVEALGQPFIDAISRRVRGQPMYAATDKLEIVGSALGDDAGIAGSALIARRLAADARPVVGAGGAALAS